MLLLFTCQRHGGLWRVGRRTRMIQSTSLMGSPLGGLPHRQHRRLLLVQLTKLSQHRRRLVRASRCLMEAKRLDGARKCKEKQGR